MSTYTQTGKVVLFKNTNKQKDNHPDYTGNVEIEGVKHRLSGWNRKDKNGISYISGALSLEESTTESDATASDADTSDSVF